MTLPRDPATDPSPTTLHPHVAPVESPAIDVDLVSLVACQAPNGCGRQAEYRIRSRCPGPHPWWSVCEKHLESERAARRQPPARHCEWHGVLIPAGEFSIEWRAL